MKKPINMSTYGEITPPTENYQVPLQTWSRLNMVKTIKYLLWGWPKKSIKYVAIKWILRIKMYIRPYKIRIYILPKLIIFLKKQSSDNDFNIFFCRPFGLEEMHQKWSPVPLGIKRFYLWVSIHCCTEKKD